MITYPPGQLTAKAPENRPGWFRCMDPIELVRPFWLETSEFSGVFPNIGVGFYPPNHPFVHRVFHEIFTIHFGESSILIGFPIINHPFWG